MELHKALKEIVSIKGKDIVNNIQIVNFLLDYQAFKEKPATKLILRDIINSGYAEEILSLDTKEAGWQMTFKKYQQEFIDSCGYKEELAAYVFESIAYGLELAISNEEPEIKPSFNFNSFFDIPEVAVKPTQSDASQQQQPSPKADSSDLYTIALSFYNEGKYQQAKGFMEKALSQNPYSNPLSLHLKLMGDIHMKLDLFQDALKYYNESFKQKATEMKVSIESLRESLKQHKVKGFENAMFCYFFCLYYSKGMSDTQWLQFVKGEARYGLMDAIQFCADYGINPVDDHFDIYFSDRSQIKNGDYLYIDGTFSHEQSQSKKILAKILLEDTSEYEKGKGWSHGYIIPISPIGEGYIIDKKYEYGSVPKFKWAAEKINLPFPHSHYTIDDLNHWDEITKIDSEQYINIGNYDMFPAFGAVNKLNSNMPIPISGTSPWFLPSISCLRRIFKGIGSIYLPYSGSTCWTSSQSDQNHAVLYARDYIMCENKYSEHPIVPVAAF